MKSSSFFSLWKVIFPFLGSISPVIAGKNHLLLRSQCFKHSWASVVTARLPTVRIRNRPNLSGRRRNLCPDAFTLIISQSCSASPGYLSLFFSILPKNKKNTDILFQAPQPTMFYFPISIFFGYKILQCLSDNSCHNLSSLRLINVKISGSLTGVLNLSGFIHVLNKLSCVNCKEI